ncbi:hypothetical protein D3C81_1840660 [compost metagenome]
MVPLDETFTFGIAANSLASSGVTSTSMSTFFDSNAALAAAGSGMIMSLMRSSVVDLLPV